MRVLALDTATEACSVALLTEHGLISDSVEIGRGHAQEILGMVDRILAEGGASLASLSGIAAGIGPGSFTGVRVSVAVAQGLAFGAGLAVAAGHQPRGPGARGDRRRGGPGAGLPGCADGRGVLGMLRRPDARDVERARPSGGGSACRRASAPRGGCTLPPECFAASAGALRPTRSFAPSRGCACSPTTAARCRRRAPWRASARCDSRRAKASIPRFSSLCTCATRLPGPKRSAAWTEVWANSTSHGTVTMQRCNSAQ